ncbi:MAG: DUF3303 domain-containing protein [Chloroflexota bacterium]
MLFHITHTHNAENCSAHKPERQKDFAGVMQNAGDFGVTLHGAYADAPGHAVYLIVEADDALALAGLLGPVLEYGQYEIRPVADAGQLLAELGEG